MHDHKNGMEKYKDKPCECCGKEHDHTYGSGRFCSEKCKIEYIALKNRGAHNPKVKAHLDKLRAEGKVVNQSPYGTWTCKVCNKVLLTRNELKKHIEDEHNVRCTKKVIVTGETFWECPYCGEFLSSPGKLGGHLAHCVKHPLKRQHDEAYERGGRTYSERYKNGEISKSAVQHRHTLETRQKISAKRAEQVMNQYLNKEHVKVKWYKVKNIEGKEFSVRGHWEENVALRLNALGILWVKAAPIKYFKDYWHNYIPDLYIPDRDIYVEVKGGYPDSDREKMRLVVEQHPEKKIYFIHKQYHDFIEGKCAFDDNLCIGKDDL